VTHCVNSLAGAALIRAKRVGNAIGTSNHAIAAAATRVRTEVCIGQVLKVMAKRECALPVFLDSLRQNFVTESTPRNIHAVFQAQMSQNPHG
jgi:hypothetical protein